MVFWHRKDPRPLGLSVTLMGASAVGKSTLGYYLTGNISIEQPGLKNQPDLRGPFTDNIDTRSRLPVQARDGGADAFVFINDLPGHLSDWARRYRYDQTQQVVAVCYSVADLESLKEAQRLLEVLGGRDPEGQTTRQGSLSFGQMPLLVGLKTDTRENATEPPDVYYQPSRSAPKKMVTRAQGAAVAALYKVDFCECSVPLDWRCMQSSPSERMLEVPFKEDPNLDEFLDHVVRLGRMAYLRWYSRQWVHRARLKWWFHYGWKVRAEAKEVLGESYKEEKKKGHLVRESLMRYRWTI